MAVEHGSGKNEQQVKNGTRIDQQNRRGEDELPPELDRRAKSTDPAPTHKAEEAERERHRKEGTRGGNI